MSKKITQKFHGYSFEQNLDQEHILENYYLDHINQLLIL